MIDANTPPPALDASTVDANARPLPQNEGLEAGLTLADTAWSDEQARRIVIADYNRASSWRASNIEPKWQEAMDTYLSEQAGQQFWKGTRIPRANLKARQAFQQVNALRPQVLDALTGQDLDFDVEVDSPGVSFTQTHAVRQLIALSLRECGARVRHQSFRSVLDKVTEDGLVLGNGVAEFGWDGPRHEVVPKWVQSPEYVSRPHPYLPLMVHHQTDRTITHQVPDSRTISRFFLDPVEQTDFYIDPDTRGPNVQMANFCLHRRLMTIEQLSELRDTEDFNIPSDQILYAISRVQSFTEGDTTRQQMQSAAGVDSAEYANMSASKDPRQAKVEVIRYWQKGRHVWLLGRRHVAWNGANAYKCLPFFNWCYVNKPGAFYGFSIPELLRPEQKLIKTMMDSRVDEINLSIHPPTITKTGTFRSQSSSTLYPGANWEALDPDKDIKRMEMPNVTQNAIEEINAAENRGQKVTGVTDLAVLGTPTSGGNSANRTATGVQAQTNASNSRVHGLVANIEDTFIKWMLYAVWTLIQSNLSPQEIAEKLGAPLDLPLMTSVLNTDPRFTMKTANNMKMRAAMQNGGLQQINQYLMNPEVLTLLSEQQGLVVNAAEWAEFALDVYGVKMRSLFRPMTPQEQQAKQQRDAQPAQEKMALQGARLDNNERQAHDRDETDLLKTFIGALIPALAQIGAGHQLLGLTPPAEIESQRLSAEIEGGKYDAQPAGDAQ